MMRKILITAFIIVLTASICWADFQIISLYSEGENAPMALKIDDKTGETWVLISRYRPPLWWKIGNYIFKSKGQLWREKNYSEIEVESLDIMRENKTGIFGKHWNKDAKDFIYTSPKDFTYLAVKPGHKSYGGDEILAIRLDKKTGEWEELTQTGHMFFVWKGALNSNRPFKFNE
jgi:hypothetical protein